ncbi:MAG TPA: hypothetical protein VGK80_04685 [Rhodanobacteraceae bacterium]
MKTIVACVLSFAACGCTFAATPSVEPAADVQAPAPSPTFKIIATDSGFEAPATLSAGLRHIVFENHGSQIHEAMLVKLPDGMTPAAYVDQVRHGHLFPQGALDYSGAGLTSPGESVEIWTRVDPGRYILICWNGNHPTTVPVHAFTVRADGSPDDIPPKEDAVLKLVDFRFELQGTLRSGMRVIRVETPGPSMHEVDIFRLRGDHTAADVNRWRKHDDNGMPTEIADAMGGLLDSHDIRRVSWLRRDFRPGRYLLHCEMPMDQAVTGKLEVTHADAGMMREFVVAD